MVIWIRALAEGVGVYFARAHDLRKDLRRARPNEHRLDRYMRVNLASKGLIIDEFGVWPYDRQATMALCALVSARYVRGSMSMTSNQGCRE